MKIPPPLRPDLVIKRHVVGGVPSYIVKDPVKLAYYRFDEEEYFVLKSIDGRRTVHEIATVYNKEYDDELVGKDIVEFVSALRSKDLFARTDVQQNIFLYEQLIAQRKNRINQAKGSILYFRIPMVDPDVFFDKVMPYIRWIWSRQCVMLMMLFMLSAIGVLFSNYGAFQAEMGKSFNFLNQGLSSLFTLWVTVASVIAIHELGHGLTCKRFSGECHEIGFLFMFFTPCMYANVNDAWMFENKHHRLYVTYAGCFIEFFVGSCAIFMWLITQSGSFINIIAFKIVVVSFFSAIFMNFNPLMRFDGYFALSDFVEIPNLRTRSRGYVAYWIQKNIFRLDREFDVLTKRENWILAIYGVLSTLYIVNVMIGLLSMIGGALISKFKVVGIFILIAIIVKFFGGMVKKFIDLIKVVIVEHEKVFTKKFVRLAVVMGIIVMGVFLTFFPIPCHFKVAATLEPSHEVVLRTLAAGYVLPLDVRKREFEEGDIVLRQENHELAQEKKLLKIDMKMNKLLAQGALAKSDLTQTVKLKKIRQKLDESMAELDRQYKNLTLHAPFKGVFSGDIDGFENTFIDQGTVIGRLIDPGIYRATFDVPEREFEGIQIGMLAHLILDVKPWKVFSGKVIQISSLHKQIGAERFYNVTVTFPNEAQILRSGLQGKISLNTGSYPLPKLIARWFRKTIRLDLQI